ncbi:MAG: alpha/beta fold hydrolase [Rhodospirillales bacterium]|nr:alpha/beta fold hydrolase [Rhodospirillales bacterium]
MVTDLPTTLQETVPAPGPLALHLALQTQTWLSSLAALSGLKGGSIPWKPHLEKAGKNLQKNLEQVDLGDFFAAVDNEARARLNAFGQGVNHYKKSPRQARPAEPPVFWQDGTTRVLDYGTGAEDARPILVVPSLINRAYILDLTEHNSLMRHLARDGFRPFLVDWGAPGPIERKFDLTAYICWRLEPVADEIFDATGQAPALLGYCMGGLLALALAARRPDRAAALALLATPWDFHAGQETTIRLLQAMSPGLKAMIDHWGELPVDVLLAMFSSLDPYSTTNKFRRFADIKTGSEQAEKFIALEDWINDGVPLAGPTARECLFDWYAENAPARKSWRVDGQPVRPENIRVPSLVVVPEKDHIVLPQSAHALADTLPGATVRLISAGHIGMVTGGRAQSTLYEPLSLWLNQSLTKIK